MAFASLGEALINVVLSVIFVRWWGVAGVALGTAIPVIAVNLLVLLPAACRTVQVKVGTLLRATTWPGLRSALPALAAAVALRWSVPPGSLAAVVLEGGAAAWCSPCSSTRRPPLRGPSAVFGLS